MYLLLGVCIDEDDTCGDPLYNSSNRSTPQSRYNFAIHPGIILLPAICFSNFSAQVKDQFHYLFHSLEL